MARKTGTHTFFASPRTERTRISIEVPLEFRDSFVADAYRLGMTQFEYLAYLRNRAESTVVVSGTIHIGDDGEVEVSQDFPLRQITPKDAEQAGIEQAAADLADEERQAKTAREAGAQ